MHFSTHFQMLSFVTQGSRWQSTLTLHTLHHFCLHAPQTFSFFPLTDHVCHFTQLSTASPSHSSSFSLLPLPDKIGSALSSRIRNLGFGSAKKQSTAKTRFPPPCLSLNHRLLRNARLQAPALEVLLQMRNA